MIDKDLRNEYWQYLTYRIDQIIDCTTDYNLEELKILKESLKANLELILENEDTFNEVLRKVRENESKFK